jgi:phospholipid-binding lipoprotein MlaA
MNEIKTSRALITGLMIALLATLPGCATKTPGQPVKVAQTKATTAPADDDNTAFNDNDPWEGVNRGIFRFDQIVDGVLLSPVAHIYRGVVPEAGQRGVHNALTNIASPVVALNSLLQWDMTNLGRTVERFAINSTVGIAGIFDVASSWGIPKQHHKDFGQTMGVWGIGSGPYVVLPIIGPSNVRDTIGYVADILSDPLTWILNTNGNIAYEVTQGIVLRADLLPLTDRINKDSLDPYATFRSVYTQHRDKVIRNYLGADAALSNEK